MRREAELWIVPTWSAWNFPPPLVSIMATPLLRRDASIARTRIVRLIPNRPALAWLQPSAGRAEAEVDKCPRFRFIPVVTEVARSQCQICHQTKPLSAGSTAELIRPSLADFIRRKVPEFDPQGFICTQDLGIFRRDYVKEVLEDEVGELSALDHEVVESLRAHEILSENIGKEFEKELTFGEHLSDRIASFGGSWKFIMLFGGVLVVWIIINTALLATRAFDPYPFILMNLILSCLAALQAPVIKRSARPGAGRE